MRICQWIWWLWLAWWPSACVRPAAGAPGEDLVVAEGRVTRVVDGDTIWVDGLDASLRLLGIDTEETFKVEGDRRAYAAGWATYRDGKRGDHLRPAKFATPLGEAARRFATDFFASSERVHVERDAPAEVRDRYGRYLAYVFVRQGGAWRNYNVECVRAGMSPYFTKYGRSRRFDGEFVAAQAEARAAQRGIWAPGAEAYPDYAEREAWWGARADFVGRFRAAAERDPDYIDLSRADALEALAGRSDREVVVLGTVDDVQDGARGPARVLLARRVGEDLPIVFWDRELLARSGLPRWRGEYVTIRGRPRGPRAHGSANQVQIVVDDLHQVDVSPVPGLTPPPPPQAPLP